MMKPPFKASDGAINVLSYGLICALCGVSFVASLSCIKYIGYFMTACAISGL